MGALAAGQTFVVPQPKRFCEPPPPPQPAPARAQGREFDCCRISRFRQPFMPSEKAVCVGRIPVTDFSGCPICSVIPAQAGILPELGHGLGNRRSFVFKQDSRLRGGSVADLRS